MADAKKIYGENGYRKAMRVKNFCENLKCTQGDWAGKPFILMPWQWEEVVLPMFGTLRENGLRQYRYCYLEIPKKSGKSPLSAALGLYGLTADREASPEVYIAAADREQAGYVFRYAAQMARENNVLIKNLKILDSRKRIINHRNNGFMQVLSSESYTKHGINPSFLIFDELHAQPNDELWNTLTSGTDYARSQQVIIAMSTAGIWNKESIWWRIREKARQIKEGTIVQNNFLPILYIADPEKDNPDNEATWIKVNPSLGYIFTLDKIREQYEEAKKDPVEYQNFLRFRLNIPIKQLARWMPMNKWDNCAGVVDLDALRGRLCYGGLDLALTRDLSAFCLVFPPTCDLEKPIIICNFYCPEENIIERSRTDKVHYEIWQAEGYLTATPGSTTDLRQIKTDILKAAENYELKELAYDKKFAEHLAIELLNEYNVPMIEMPQLAKYFNAPMGDLLKEVIAGNVMHDGNPVLRWNFDNVVIKTYHDGSIQPDKANATERIDGAVATFMAWGRYMMAMRDSSVYEERGLTLL